MCRLTVGLRFLPLRGFYRPAVFTAPRFLPLRGFYRSAVFTAPLSPVLWGGFALPPPSCLLPPSLPHFRAARSLGHLTVRLGFLPLRGFYRSAVFPAPRFLPLRGFYRSAVFTAPRFLPLRDFYRSAVFTAPLSPVLWGALLFHRPRACCPPVFPHFRAARSLGHLTVRLRFYRSAVFTAPRFLPLRDFYRSAIFSAPLSPVLWGALLFLSAPQSSPSSGRTLCYRLLRSVSGGTPF